MEKIELKFYRHKKYKDVYLACDPFRHEPYATKDILNAINFHKYIAKYLPILADYKEVTLREVENEDRTN